jgi:hypothetical protein
MTSGRLSEPLRNVRGFLWPNGLGLFFCGLRSDNRKWSRRELNPDAWVYKTLRPTWRPLLAIRGRAAYLLPEGRQHISTPMPLGVAPLASTSG